MSEKITSGTLRLSFTLSSLPSGEYASRRRLLSFDHCVTKSEDDDKLRNFDCVPAKDLVAGSKNSAQLG